MKAHDKLGGPGFIGGGLVVDQTELGEARCEGSANMQALIVDDSAVFRKLISDHLQSWGFGVTAAVNGTEAQHVLDQPNPPRLILLDWIDRLSQYSESFILLPNL